MNTQSTIGETAVAAAGGRRQQAEARRDELLDAALDLFSEKGFAAATIADLAEAAGVSQGLIYHYFDTKVDLLLAVIRKHGLLARLQSMLTPIPDRPARDILMAIAGEWWKVFREKRKFMRMVWGESQRNERLTRVMGEVAREGSDSLTRYLKSRADCGELRADADLEVAARMFFSSLFMFFMEQERFSPPLRRIAPRRFIGDAVDIVLRGLEEEGS